jgi:hypothetical protein
MILQGVDRYRVVEPMYEGIRVILSYRGEPYSPAYIQGLSGAAFRVAGICPCAPTCSTAMDPRSLIRLLGYEFEECSLFGADRDPERDIQEMVARVKTEIDAGRPALVWHAFTNAEWDVVCGYDGEAFYGRGSYQGLDGYAKAAQTRAKDAVQICPAFGAILVGAKSGALDAHAAETASLHEAIKHAHTQAESKPGGRDWVFLEGFRAYQRWADEYRSDPQKRRGPGDSYCLGVYRHTHRAAGEYLCEIAPRHPELSAALLRAAEHFAVEADLLDQAEPLLGWQSPQGPDAERNQKAADLLSKAFAAYQAGIGEIEAALAPQTAEVSETSGL